MNILHMKYAIEVARSGSLGKASEKLLIAVPNISRSIKELEADIGITIFERNAKGMTLTPDGEDFISMAQNIVSQFEQAERFYKEGAPKKQKFSISVPRACYISEAFAEFTKSLTNDSAEIFYKETNSQRTISNMTNHDYKLGIIRYAENYDMYFKTLLEEKGFEYELVTEFNYSLLMSRDNPLSEKEKITFADLSEYIEIAHADPYVPSMPQSKVFKEELPDNISRRIFIFERASQFELLAKNSQTFMWVSSASDHQLSHYNLVKRKCPENQKIYKDVLIYKKGYKLTKLDREFIKELVTSKELHFK